MATKSETKSTDELDEMSRWKTPKSDRLRAGYGSLLMSAQTVRGLCPSARCIRKAEHAGACWPKG